MDPGAAARAAAARKSVASRSAESSRARITEAIDKMLAEAEQTLLAHHTMRLTNWTKDRQATLQKATELDMNLMQESTDLNEMLLHDLESLSADQKRQRRVAFQESKHQGEVAEAAFAKDLADLAKAKRAEVADCLQRCCAHLRERSLDIEKSGWMQLEAKLQAVLVRCSRTAATAIGYTSSLVEVYETGLLQPYLNLERDGWARSQRTDLQQLESELEQDFGAVFETFRSQLESSIPYDLQAPALAAMQDLVAAEKETAAKIKVETCEAYAAELQAAMYRCEEDYHGYDVRLNEIIARTLSSRLANISAMRQLKLLLCTWRLDYQRVYHEALAKNRNKQSRQSRGTIQRPSSPLSARGMSTVSGISEAVSEISSKMSEAAKDRQEGLERQATMRLLHREVGRLWSQNKIPIPEMQRFLGKVVEALLKDGLAGPIMDMYRQEAKEYGALPLLRGTKVKNSERKTFKISSSPRS